METNRKKMKRSPESPSIAMGPGQIKRKTGYEQGERRKKGKPTDKGKKGTTSLCQECIVSITNERKRKKKKREGRPLTRGAEEQKGGGRIKRVAQGELETYTEEM